MPDLDPFCLEKTAAHVKSTVPALASGWFEQKAITIDFDFPGAKQYGRLGQTANVGLIRENTVYFKTGTTPAEFKFRPVLLIPIVQSSGADITISTYDLPKLITWDTENVSISASGEPIRLWNEDTEEFSSEITTIADIEYDPDAETSVLVLDGTPDMMPAEGYGYIGQGQGLEEIIDYVLVDRPLDLSDTRKPYRITADVHSPAIYRARIDTAKLDNWQDLPTGFRKQIKRQCSRIFWDGI